MQNFKKLKGFAEIVLVIISVSGILGAQFAAAYDPIVFEAQKKLDELGYDVGKPDGIWGKKSVEAVKSFQHDTGLAETGKLDELTKFRLHEAELPVKLSLSEAVKLNAIPRIKVLLEEGADVNARDELGECPLHIAAVRGYGQAASMLLDKGADINAGDERGLTPLHAAAWSGNDEIVTLLLGKGADINAVDQDGVTPLHAAALAGRNETVTLLIARGADINAENKEGMTPLHAAVLADNRETVALLIEKGANAAAANQSGATPLDTAAQNGDKDMMKLLRQHIHQQKKATQ